MRFSVPQFIDVEDKIFGPLTLTQGIYLAGGLGGAYLFYAWLGWWGAVLIGLPILGLAIVFAFVKVNNRSFTAFASAAFFFFIKRKLYLWRREPKKVDLNIPHHERMKMTEAHTPKVSQSRLRAIAFSLDTQDMFAQQKDRSVFDD